MKNVIKTRQQMALEYGVCAKTFRKLLKSEKIELGNGLITPKMQDLIYDRLGVPKSAIFFQISSEKTK